MQTGARGSLVVRAGHSGHPRMPVNRLIGQQNAVCSVHGQRLRSEKQRPRDTGGAAEGAHGDPAERGRAGRTPAPPGSRPHALLAPRLPPHGRAGQGRRAGRERRGPPWGVETLSGETELFSILITVMVSQRTRTSEFFTLCNLNTCCLQ